MPLKSTSNKCSFVIMQKRRKKCVSRPGRVYIRNIHQSYNSRHARCEINLRFNQRLHLLLLSAYNFHVWWCEIPPHKFRKISHLSVLLRYYHLALVVSKNKWITTKRLRSNAEISRDMQANENYCFLVNLATFLELPSKLIATSARKCVSEQK